MDGKSSLLRFQQIWTQLFHVSFSIHTIFSPVVASLVASGLGHVVFFSHTIYSRLEMDQDWISVLDVHLHKWIISLSASLSINSDRNRKKYNNCFLFICGARQAAGLKVPGPSNDEAWYGVDDLHYQASTTNRTNAMEFSTMTRSWAMVLTGKRGTCCPLDHILKTLKSGQPMNRLRQMQQCVGTPSWKWMRRNLLDPRF